MSEQVPGKEGGAVPEKNEEPMAGEAEEMKGEEGEEGEGEGDGKKQPTTEDEKGEDKVGQDLGEGKLEPGQCRDTHTQHAPPHPKHQLPL